MENVVCNYSSFIADLNQCSHDGWGVHNCSHDQDVYITCSDRDPYGTAKMTSVLSAYKGASRHGRPLPLIDQKLEVVMAASYHLNLSLLATLLYEIRKWTKGVQFVRLQQGLCPWTPLGDHRYRLALRGRYRPFGKC